MTRAPARQVRLPFAERREQLIRAAQEAFLTLGADRASMKLVADHAGVNPALLYQHFDSNQALFEAAMQEPLRELVVEQIAAVRKRVAGAPVGQQPIELHRAMLELMHQAAPAIGVTVFSDKFNGREFYAKQIEAPLLKVVGDSLKKAGASMSKDSLQLFAAALLGVYFNCAIDAIQRDEDLDIEATARRIDVMFASAALVALE